jgi:hypothetical protein
MNTTVIYGLMLTFALGIASVYSSGDVRTALMVAAGCSALALVLTVGIDMASNNAGRKARVAAGAVSPKTSVKE